MYSNVNEIASRYDSKEILDLETRVDCYTWCYPINLGDVNPLEIWKENSNVKMYPKRMTLYIHVPYCKFICSMCPFTHEPLNLEKLNAYVEALLKEIKLYAKHNLSKKVKISSIYFGGGTASLLKEEHIEAILSMIYKKYNVMSDCEITLECHPRTVDNNYLENIKKLGINRVTFGIQSFNQKFLDSLKLHQKVDQSIETIKRATQVGFKTVAMDLMYNFPDQKLEDLSNDIDKALDLGVQGISFYALDSEVRELDDVKQKQNILLDEKKMFNYIYDRMQEANFVQVAQPDYSLRGHENKQIMDLWGSPQCQNLGFGAGAFSESFNGFTWANVHHPDKYISMMNQNRFPVLMGKKWSLDDAISRFPALGVRCLKLDLNIFDDMFDVKFKDIYKYEIQLLKRYEYIEIKDNTLSITQKGKFYIDNISKCFFNLSNRGKTQLWGCNLRDVMPNNEYSFESLIQK
ncbi:coproporphyrinogen-III oxidase family protein [Clostridiaceae bacterium M8S5]|nr:coproporphyrinogen-III oxidase family protein [Clostridiaceae bacterium M8S5]